MNRSTPGVFLEIGVDERGRLGLGDPQPARQAEGAQPIDHAEIDRLGHAAHRRVDRPTRRPGRSGRRRRGGCRGPRRRPGTGPGRRNNGPGSAARSASSRPSRAASPARPATNAWRICRPSSVRTGMFCRLGSLELSRPGRRHALVERGVDPAVLGMHQLRQRIEIGALELGELAMLDQQGRAAGA